MGAVGECSVCGMESRKEGASEGVLYNMNLVRERVVKPNHECVVRYGVWRASDGADDR